MSATEVDEVKQEAVTFWCHFEGRPSNQRINCGGGEKHVDGEGKVYTTPYHEAEFLYGKCTVSDPTRIAALRKLAKDRNSGITEDHEAYLMATLPKEKQIQRLQSQLNETNRLKAELEKANAALDAAKEAAKAKRA